MVLLLLLLVSSSSRVGGDLENGSGGLPECLVITEDEDTRWAHLQDSLPALSGTSPFP